jgi:Tfp pilus assembly protein PilF
MPDDPRVDDTIGWIYYKKDLASLAVAPLEDASKKQPNYADAHYHLGMTYAKLGERAKARESLERALKLNPKIGGDEARRVLASVSQ